MMKTKTKDNNKWIKAIAAMAIIIAVLISGAFLLKKANSVYTENSYPLKYEKEIDAASKKYGVDKALIYGVIKTESNFVPDARSSAGALGLMQLMPDTFEWLQTYYKDENDYTFEDLADPAINIDYGAELLSILSKRYENEETMLCAYNGGLGNVDEWLADPQYSDDGKTLKAVPFNETNNYRRLVEQHKSIYNKLYFSGDSSAVK